MIRERVNQKRRTRAALVAAAAELVRQGKAPTVGAVADAAQVSRATAYRYFPTQEVLLVEATLQPEVDPAVEQALALSKQADIPTRLDTLVEALQTATLAHEDMFRALVRLSLEPRPDEHQGDTTRREEPARGHLRGGRRIRWLEDVLGPASGKLAPQAFQRLVAALSLCMGIESLIVLQDICDLDAEEATATSRWAARALLYSALGGEGESARHDCPQADKEHQR